MLLVVCVPDLVHVLPYGKGLGVCPTGLQSVCNLVLWELREERSEAAKREAPPLSTLTPSKAGRWRRSLRLS